MTLEFKLNQVLYLEDLRMGFPRILTAYERISTENDYINSKIYECEIVRIDNGYYYFLEIGRFDRVHKISKDTPFDDENFRIWNKKEDCINMHIENRRIYELKRKAKDLIDGFTEFQINEFIELNT